MSLGNCQSEVNLKCILAAIALEDVKWPLSVYSRLFITVVLKVQVIGHLEHRSFKEERMRKNANHD